MAYSEDQWLRYLLPLPHEIAIEGSFACAPAAVAIEIAGKDDLADSAAEQLRGLFSERAGVLPKGGEFSIVLKLVDAADGDADQARLRELPNRDQAYCIGSLDGDGLVLAALDGRGLVYAARTLCQLLEPTLSSDRVEIPLVRVVDWPDLDERGLWNFPDPSQWLPWMASLKLNYGKMASTDLAPIERDEPGSANIDSGLMKEARRLAFNYVPYIVHLNFLHDTGLFRVYPELAGKGDRALAGRYFAHKQGSQHRAPCASQPLLVQFIAQWMDSIASQGATEISCWLTERPAQCECVDCMAVGQFLLETRAFLNAWRQTLTRYPGLMIRIFSSTATADDDDRILAELPPEVRFERACATGMERVAHRPRDRIANPLLDRCASEGRWIASYDVPVGAYGRVDTPEFKLPHFSAHRIRDFVGQLIRRRYSGAYAMMAWGTHGVETCGFNINALAEWSWNLDGRTEREFALAWATREKCENPESVAEWAELIGPIEFDVYDSGFPMCYSWGLAVDMVRERRRPGGGEGMFRYYADSGDFERKLEVCDRALVIAGSLSTPGLALVTGVVRSYVELSRRVYDVAELFATADLTSLSDQDRLVETLRLLEKAGEENVAAIRAWRSSLGPEPWAYRVYDAIEATQHTVAAICDHIRHRYLY